MFTDNLVGMVDRLLIQNIFSSGMFGFRDGGVSQICNVIHKKIGDVLTQSTKSVINGNEDDTILRYGTSIVSVSRSI